MNERSTSVRLRAEVDQYIRDMGRASQATANFGQAGTRTGVQLARAQKQQVDSAMSVRIAEERLKETRAQSNAAASQILSAEQNLARAKDQSTQATAAATRAEAAHVTATRQSSTAMGRLAASARENRDAWTQASVPLLAVGTGVTAMGVAALRTGIQYNTLQQTTRAALTTLTGSAAEASAQMDKLDEFARTSPFAKQTFIQAQQQLLGFGMEASKVLPTLDAIQNAVAAFGGSNNDIAEIAFIFSQIQAAGKITATDLMQLGQRGVDAATLIGSQMGMTGAQIRESITAGSLSAGDALDALTAGMDQRFGGAAENVKNTFTGAIDRVMAAWRDLSSELAAPFVGPEGGGLFTGLLNETADLMRGFQDLPGPVKTAGTYMAATAGAASLLGGAFLFLLPRALDTVDSLREIGLWSDTTGGKLRGAAKAAGILAAAFATVQAASKLFTQDEISTGIETWTRALAGAAEGSESSIASLEKLATVKAPSFMGVTFTDDVNGLADAIGNLDPSNWEKFLNSGGPGASKLESSAVVLERVDDVLTSLVQKGNVDEAARMFDYLSEVAEKNGTSLGVLREHLPGYQNALDGVANEQRAASESADQMQGSLEAAAARLGVSTQALEQMRDQAQSGAEAIGQLGAEFDYANASAGEFIEHMLEQQQALRDFQRNAYLAGEKGLNEGLIMHLQSLGPEGAAMLAQFSGATQSEIAKANAAWMGHQEQLESAKNAIDGIPGTKTTRFITPGLSAARDATRELDRILRNMPLTRNIRITTTRSGDDSPGRSAVGRRDRNADGGFYVGPVKARAAGGLDEYGRAVPRLPQLRNGNQGTVMWGEPETGWEAYISGKPGMEARNRGILADAAERLGMAVMPLDLGQITAFADGGRLDRLNAQRRVRDLQRDLRETEVVGKGRNRRRRRVLRGLDAQIAREELREARAELADLRRPVSQRRAAREQRREDISRGTSDYLGNTDLSEGALRSPAAVERALQQSIADMATFTMLLIELKKKGASPWLLGQLQGFGPGKGTIRLARQYLADNAKLRSTNALAAQAQSVAGVYGSVTTDARWDATKAWNPAISGAQSQALTRNTTLNVQLDGNYLSREVAKLVEHQLSLGMGGAVMPV